MEKPKQQEKQRGKFGWFAGVFTPSILTILSAILFMRANFVVGEAGVSGMLLVMLLANAIAVLSALSVCAVSTNMQVRGGGAYFLISRVLGPEFGGSIGLVFFVAMALSVPFNILGFTEAFVRTYPGLDAVLPDRTCGCRAAVRDGIPRRGRGPSARSSSCWCSLVACRSSR